MIRYVVNMYVDSIYDNISYMRIPRIARKCTFEKRTEWPRKRTTCAFTIQRRTLECFGHITRRGGIGRRRNYSNESAKGIDRSVDRINGLPGIGSEGGNRAKPKNVGKYHESWVCKKRHFEWKTKRKQNNVILRSNASAVHGECGPTPYRASYLNAFVTADGDTILRDSDARVTRDRGAIGCQTNVCMRRQRVTRRQNWQFR